MGIGPRVRRGMGPLEPVVTNLCRAMFFDVRAFARKLGTLARPRRVLEVGCGEGAVLTQLARQWKDASFDGIDEEIVAVDWTGVYWQRRK